MLVVLAALVVRDVTTSFVDDLDGACVDVTEFDLLEVPCSGPHDGRVIEVVESEPEGLCPPTNRRSRRAGG